MIRAQTNSIEVQEFLEEMFDELKKQKRNSHKIVLVMDNHAAHHSKMVECYLKSQDTELFFLPVYSSPLNSKEKVWSYIK